MKKARVRDRAFSLALLYGYGSTTPLPPALVVGLEGSKSVGVGGSTMMTLVTELLEGMGLDEIDVPEDDEAGPGMSSVRTMFFAADHEKTFSRLKDELRSHLEQQWAVMQDEPPNPPVLKKPAKPAKKKAVAAKKKQPSTRGKRR